MTNLVIPNGTQTDSVHPLIFERNHPAARYGRATIVTLDGQVIDGHIFRFLRDFFHAHIETDDPLEVRSSLGLPASESGVQVCSGPDVSRTASSSLRL